MSEYKYKPTTWIGGKTIGTADVMNNIEDGIVKAHERLDNISFDENIGNIDLSEYAKKTDIPIVPTNISAFTNDKGYLTSVPSEYVTETELNSKGYLTEHQDLSSYATKSELHNHSNKTVLDGITSAKVEEWNNKSTFSGNYNDLTNKPTIPTKTSQLNNDSNYLTSIPSEYVTESELIAKGYATQTELNNKLNKNFGSENAGKILVVDENGYLVLDDMPEGTSYPVIGTVDENNVITLSSDKLEDGLYILRYSNGEEYQEIGKILVGEKIVTKITATKTKTSYDEGETLTTDDIRVTAYYNDETSSSVTGYKVDSSSVNMSTKGSYQLKISYMNCTANITITVNSLADPTGNLFVSSTCTIGKRINSSGLEKDQIGTFLTDFIEIGKCMSRGGTNIIHWKGFHLYKVTSDELAQAGVADNAVGTYKGVAYYDATGKFLGQDSLYVTEKAYDGEGNYQLHLNSTYSTATKLRIFGVTLPPATTVNDLQNCKLTLNQLISEI